MNKKQSIVLSVAAGVILLMLVIPPFNLTIKGTTFNMGYSFILEPPKRGILLASVNYWMLLVQWVGVLILGGIAYFICRDGDKRKEINRGIDTEDRMSLPNWDESTATQAERAESANDKELSSEYLEVTERDADDDSEVIDFVEIDQSKKFLGGQHHPWRRFFARFADMFIFALLFAFLSAFIVAKFLPQHFDQLTTLLENTIIASIVTCVIWIPFEANLLSMFGSTLGKWIFGITVTDLQGEKLRFSAALERSGIVWCHGQCFGIPILMLFTQYASYKRLTQKGTTHWDNTVGVVVHHKPWGSVRTLLCACFIFSLFIIASILGNL